MSVCRRARVARHCGLSAPLCRLLASAFHTATPCRAGIVGRAPDWVFLVIAGEPKPRSKATSSFGPGRRLWRRSRRRFGAPTWRKRACSQPRPRRRIGNLPENWPPSRNPCSDETVDAWLRRVNSERPARPLSPSSMGEIANDTVCLYCHNPQSRSEPLQSPRYNRYRLRCDSGAGFRLQLHSVAGLGRGRG